MITTYKINGIATSNEEIKTDEELRLFVLHNLEKRVMQGGILTIEDENLIDQYLNTDIEFDENVEVTIEDGIMYIEDTWVLK